MKGDDFEQRFSEWLLTDPEGQQWKDYVDSLIASRSKEIATEERMMAYITMRGNTHSMWDMADVPAFLKDSASDGVDSIRPHADWPGTGMYSLLNSEIVETIYRRFAPEDWPFGTRTGSETMWHSLSIYRVLGLL